MSSPTRLNHIHAIEKQRAMTHSASPRRMSSLDGDDSHSNGSPRTPPTTKFGHFSPRVFRRNSDSDAFSRIKRIVEQVIKTYSKAVVSSIEPLGRSIKELEKISLTFSEQNTPFFTFLDFVIRVNDVVEIEHALSKLRTHHFKLSHDLTSRVQQGMKEDHKIQVLFEKSGREGSAGVSLTDIDKRCVKLDLLGELGRGAFAVAFLVQDFQDKKDKVLLVEYELRNPSTTPTPLTYEHIKRADWYMRLSRKLEKLGISWAVRVERSFCFQHNIFKDYGSGYLCERLTPMESLKASKVLGFCADFLSKVNQMHEKGIVHGDIKLANLMVRNGSDPVLIDWDPCTVIDDEEIEKMNLASFKAYLEGVKDELVTEFYVPEHYILKVAEFINNEVMPALSSEVLPILKSRFWDLKTEKDRYGAFCVVFELLTKRKLSEFERDGKGVLLKKSRKEIVEELQALGGLPPEMKESLLENFGRNSLRRRSSNPF